MFASRSIIVNVVATLAENRKVSKRLGENYKRLDRLVLRSSESTIIGETKRIVRENRFIPSKRYFVFYPVKSLENVRRRNSIFRIRDVDVDFDEGRREKKKEEEEEAALSSVNRRRFSACLVYPVKGSIKVWDPCLDGGKMRHNLHINSEAARRSHAN